MIRTNRLQFEPATAGQKLAITRLCVALGIKEPIEELPMSKGEAGRQIRSMIDKLVLYKKGRCER